MRHALRPVILTALAVALGLSAAPAVAERNLVPILERSFDICPDRPAEPLWMQDIPLRQVYQRVLIQDIYRAQSLERVNEAGRCDCATRFPSWDMAEAEFRDRYASAERWEMIQASEGYNRRANAARPAAKVLCEAVGNW